MSKGHSTYIRIENPLHRQSEKPACASKQDVLELATLRYTERTPCIVNKMADYMTTLFMNDPVLPLITRVPIQALKFGLCLGRHVINVRLCTIYDQIHSSFRQNDNHEKYAGMGLNGFASKKCKREK